MSGKLQAELKKTKPFSSLEQEVYLSLQRTADALGRGFADLLKAHALSPAQYNVLRILRGAGEVGLACQEVGSRMITREPDVTRLMDRLETRGLLERRRQQDDRRVVKARVTAAGLELLSKLDAPVVKLHDVQLGHLSRERLRSLCELLEAAREKV